MIMSWSRTIGILSAIAAALTAGATAFGAVSPKWAVYAVVAAAMINAFTERVQGGKSVAALLLCVALLSSQIACGPPSKSTIQKLYAGAHVVTVEIQTNITLPDQLLAEKLITPEQFQTVKKYIDQALSGAQIVEKGLSDALTAEKPSLGTLAPTVADIIMNLRGLTALVNNEKVQKFFAAVEIGLRVLGSYFALQISAARGAGFSDRQICRNAGIRYEKDKFDLLATAYEGARFDEFIGAL
jgi:hypothetical protein